MYALLHTEHLTQISLKSWQLDPPVIVGIVAASALYLWAITPPERDRYPNSEAVPRSQIALFFTGLLAFAVALLSPIEPLSDSFLFSGHMIQHALITIVGPPLVLLGVPRWLYEAMARGLGRVWTAWRFLTQPLLAFFLFNITFALVHFPSFYNLALQDENVHILEHILLWATAFVGWWCILAPTRELGALSRPMKGLYLVACTLPGQLVGAVITFSDSVLYSEYLHANRVWGLSPKTDQEIGGLIMWVGIGNFFIVAAMFVFYRWASEQTASDRRRTEAATARRLAKSQ